MKSLLLSLTVLLSSFSSFAQSSEGNLEFVVTGESQFSENHVKNPGAARINVNFAESKATLTVEERYYCPPNMICATVMPAPVVVELPITAIEDAGCGIRMITASRDDRPVDGINQVLQIEDATQMTCPTFAPYKAKASYTTQVFDRMQGFEVKSESTMVIDLAPEALRDLQTLKMSEGAFQTGFSMFEKPVSGTLEIGERDVKLTVDVRLNCGKGKACPRYLPRPLVVVLPITSVEKSEQGNRIVAQMDTFNANGVRESIEIHDSRDCRVCTMDTYRAVKVDYKAQLQTSSGPVTRQGTFYFY